MTPEDHKLLLSVIGMLVYDVAHLARNALSEGSERSQMIRECVAMADILVEQLENLKTKEQSS